MPLGETGDMIVSWVNQSHRFERQAHSWEFNFATDVTDLIGSYDRSWEIDRTWSPYFNLGVATSSIKYCSMNKPRKLAVQNDAVLHSYS